MTLCIGLACLSSVAGVLVAAAMAMTLAAVLTSLVVLVGALPAEKVVGGNRRAGLPAPRTILVRP
ncbi:hypothetical protein ACFWAY_51270 [Rhodococcus sp. NPDC059968]|uniref:hypothetical protein n=1 Tax=Rhodococcus sp. NPDC059968 TaxID=3347017 RepID=UPI00366CA480